METFRLAAIPLFAHLEDADIAMIAAAAREVEVDEGHALTTQGEFGHALFAIESGTAEVTLGGEKRVTLGPGDVFGEVAVMAAGRRTASVVATSPMHLIALFKRDVWALERQSPRVAARLRTLVAERRDSTAEPA
jgi:voltage-gated potassium channel